MNKLQFKFNPDDKCFTLNGAKVVEGTVMTTNIKMVKSSVDITYQVKLKSEKVNRTEEYVFETKDELIASL
jgi:hypothetical protein